MTPKPLYHRPTPSKKPLKSVQLPVLTYQILLKCDSGSVSLRTPHKKNPEHYFQTRRNILKPFFYTYVKPALLIEALPTLFTLPDLLARVDVQMCRQNIR